MRLCGLLLENGADPNQEGRDHFRPLHIACSRNAIEFAGLLLRHGADANARNSRTVIGGYRNVITYTPETLIPLHIAARRGHVEMAQLLLDHGADPTVPDDPGTVAYDLAPEGSRVRGLLKKAQMR
jgi:ankyrin repeat protein